MPDGRPQPESNDATRDRRQGPDLREDRPRDDRRDRRPPADTPAPVESARPPRLSDAPDEQGRFGPYGGVYVPETLMGSLKQIEEEYLRVQRDRDFWTQLAEIHRTFIGRPTTLHLAQRVTDAVRAKLPRGGQSSEGKGARIWFKREDLAHMGSHCINNAIGQALLAQRLGKTRLISESANGQHGVAVATVGAHLGLEVEVFIGGVDAKRQPLNVARMRTLGATVQEVEGGNFQDAWGAAMRRWQEQGDVAHYLSSSAIGPHPYPAIVRDFQSIMGRETKAQSLRAFGKLPDAVVACVGGGCAAAGMFFHFLEDAKVALIGVEAGGAGDGSGGHAASLLHGSVGILNGAMTYVLQDAEGRAQPGRSCATGLQCAAAGPELAFWKDAGRVQYVAARDEQALAAFDEVSRLEGIIPSLEGAHALAHALAMSATLSTEANLVVCLSGRGDKDLDEVASRRR